MPGPTADPRALIKVRVTEADSLALVRMYRGFTGMVAGPEAMAAILLHLAVEYAPTIASMSLEVALTDARSKEMAEAPQFDPSSDDSPLDGAAPS